MKPRVICLPGGVAPATQRYASLATHVGDDAELHLKDLEVYRGAAPRADYSVEQELVAIDAFADERGLDDFHLLAYSGGGFLSLAYAGTRPNRVRSLAVFEPATIPGPPTDEEKRAWDALMGSLRGLDGPAFMEMFVRKQLKAGVPMPQPPPGPPSPEMQKRPGGIAAMTRAFAAFAFDRSLLTECPFAVFYGYGELTDDASAIRASVLARLFGDFHVRRFQGVHHFVPAELIYTPEHCRILLDHWRRAG
jgi:pimeloyl-ACP methyl ester carboxylesterase